MERTRVVGWCHSQIPQIHQKRVYHENRENANNGPKTSNPIQLFYGDGTLPPRRTEPRNGTIFYAETLVLHFFFVYIFSRGKMAPCGNGNGYRDRSTGHEALRPSVILVNMVNMTPESWTERGTKGFPQPRPKDALGAKWAQKKVGSRSHPPSFACWRLRTPVPRPPSPSSGGSSPARLPAPF